MPAVDRTDANLRDVVQILRERRMWVAAPTALAMLCGLSYLIVAPRVYTGVTSILIDARTRPAVGDINTVPNGSPDAVLVESQVRLIASEPVLRRVVAAEDLADDAEFAPQGPGLRQGIVAALGLAKSRSASTEDRETRAVLNLAPRIAVLRSERTYIADIQVTSSDPNKAARLANAVAKAYLADQQAARNQSAERDSDWVRGQISSMQTGLQEAESKAEAFRREHGIIGANGKLLNEQDLADAATALAEGHTKTSEIKARYDQIQRVISSGRNLDALPDALKSATIDKLRSQFADITRQQASLRQTLGARHPALLESEQQLRDVRRLIADELTRVQAGLANEYQTAQANIAGLDKHFQELKQATVLSNEGRLHLDELQRDVDARRAVYDRFLRARDTVREQAVDAPIGRIIAPALAPMAPSAPKALAVLPLSLAAGLTIGIGLALLSDLMLDGRKLTRRASPTSVDPDPKRQRLGLQKVPFLGTVPPPFGATPRLQSPNWLLERLRAAWPTTLDIDPEPLHPAFLKAVELIDKALPYEGQLGAQDCRILLVTSVSGFESRTTLALALAQAAAGSGDRALVIDAEGSGGLLRDLVAPGAAPALLDLMGTKRLCYRVLANLRGSLSVVPVAADEARVALRLATKPDTVHIDGIAGHFDVVIFDGPTIGRMSRLNAIASNAETIVVVAPLEATQDDLDQAVALFDLPSASVVVAVGAAEIGESARASVAA